MESVTATQLVLMRHGETAANRGGSGARMSGWTDLPMSAAGVYQVSKLVERLRAGPRFDALYSSPLARAARTAHALADAGLGVVCLCRSLMEINGGEIDGLPVGEVQDRFPELWRANQQQDDADFGWPGGETYRDFRGRCVDAIGRIAGRHRGGRVAIVTHAGVISQIVGFINGTNPARWELFRPGNGSLTQIDWEGRSGVLVAFDDRSHLPSDLADRPLRPSARD
jgi:broad specificity phosphatase PhoE